MLAPKAVNPRTEKELMETLVMLRDTDECKRFLYDLCTHKEIADFAARWWVARLLDEGKHSYREIHDMTGVSVTTIGRVARFLQYGRSQGYRVMLDRFKAKRGK